MPCITIKTNCPLPPETQSMLKAELGETISLIPRKSEKWLMCLFEQAPMWLSGTDEPAAIAELQLFGSIAPDVFSQFTEQITHLLSSTLNIPPERIYCACFETSFWGWNGKPF